MVRDMKYIKVFTDFEKAMAPLGDAERGRLFTAMLMYAECGDVPEFRGNERFLWPTAKLQIDRDAETYGRKAQTARANGTMGGRKKTEIAQAETEKTNIGSFGSEKTEIAQDKDKDKDKDKYKNEKEKRPSGVKRKGAAAPTPPSVEDVRAYCAERANGIDPQAFVDYYDARGWRYGQGKPIVDWRAAVRTWENRRRQEGGVTGGTDRLSVDTGARTFRGWRAKSALDEL